MTIGEPDLRGRLASRAPHAQGAIIADIAGDLRDRILKSGDDAEEAMRAVDAIKRWSAGEAISGKTFSDIVYDDWDQGTLRRLTDAEGRASKPAWNALTTAVMYVAWLAYRQTGETMPEDVAEVDESTLDLLEQQLSAVAG